MKDSVALRIASSPAEAWERIMAPWFHEVLAHSWKEKLPAVVAVPTRAHAIALKARLIEQGQSHLGIQFVTPTGLRELLRPIDLEPPPMREHLQLLLAIAAQEENNEENFAAKSVLRAPEHLLRAIERFEIAGWKLESVSPDSFHPIIRRFRQLCRSCNFPLVGEFDRELLNRPSKIPAIHRLLIAGFDGAHWPLWFLLRASVQAATKALIVLDEPREPLSDFDLCWIGSWEEKYGEAKRHPSADAGDSFFTESEMRGTGIAAGHVGFRIATNFCEQAETIVSQCIRYLADPKCVRLGVIFPAAGALPRLVSHALAESGIPHNDGFAHPLPGVFEAADWRAWLELQSIPRLNSFLNFVNAAPEILPEGLESHVVDKILRESWSEVLLDDLQVIAEFCRRGDLRAQATATLVRQVRLLPAKATLPEFLNETTAAFAELRWKHHATHLANLAGPWAQGINLPISRTLYLRWLTDAASSIAPGRAAAANHPYARVHLLSIAEAQNQEWSHVIVAGCNEGNWPPPPAAEFGRVQEIRLFNASAQQLNKRSTSSGRHGEGQTTIRDEHSFYLGPVEQRAIAIGQLEALTESAAQALTLTASLLHEDAPERLWNPGETFTQLYRTVRGEPLTQSAIRACHRATTKWVEEIRRTGAETLTSSPTVEQTLVAFRARRDGAKSAGEYDFALRPNESYHPVPILSVSDLEEMVKAPAIVWMKRYLGVKAPDDTSNPWAATTGKWVHVWLAGLGPNEDGKLFGAHPSPALADKRIEKLADERREALEQICGSLRKTVPDWWISGWLNARYLARHLGAKMAGVSDWRWITTEYAVGRDGITEIASDVRLHLRGRIDLILATTDAKDFSGQRLWIVDYKTGGTRELKASDLHDALVKGDALQLGLYSLALKALGSADVSASIISSQVRKIAPQLPVTELEPHREVFADLAKMQQSGVFGMKGELRPAFGYSAAYPLATIAIDDEILEDKWQQTHSHLVLEKEEWDRW